MNTSQYMDKQIMDLSSQGSMAKKKDSVDLINHPSSREDDDHGDYNDDVINREEIVPSYDFQPIRSVGASAQALNIDVADCVGGSARPWNSLDSKTDSSSPIRIYGSFDSLEPPKGIIEKESKSSDAAMLSEIDCAIKKHADNLLHVMEGVSARLTQLESRTRHLESSVDDLKVSIGNNHGSTDGKMRQLENVLREVQTGIHDLKDKQEIMGAQLQLADLRVSSMDRQSENQVTGQLSIQHAASASKQSHEQLPPVNFPQSLPVQLPSQFLSGQVPSVPQRETYFPTPVQAQDVPIQQYQLATSSAAPHIPSAVPHPHNPSAAEPPQHAPSAAAAPPHVPSASQPQLPHQQYQPVPQPQYLQPSQLPQQHPSLAPVNAPQHQPSLGHHPEESQYIPSQSYPHNLRKPPSQPSTGPPPSQQQFYGGAPAHSYEPPSGRTNAGFSTGYGPPSGLSEQYPHSGPSQYGSSTMKPQQHSSPSVAPSSGSGYPQLPTARILPHALPTASGVGAGSGSGSTGTGNRVPADDVIDRVTSMGFPRDHVRATVRKLTENGQTVDLNIVLDKLMNDGEIQPPRGWFGR